MEELIDIYQKKSEFSNASYVIIEKILTYFQTTSIKISNFKIKESNWVALL